MNPAAGPIRKFNPGTGQSDREVVDQFVVRKHELDIVLDILKSNIDVDCCQSTLVVAPRGAGKTMLLARVAAELRANPAFAPHLLPVRLMEENHEAYDIGEFYLEVLFHLVLEIEAAMPDIARDLRRTHEDLCARWRPDLAPQALGALLGAADRLDRRLVLLVENLQSLCRDTDDDFGWSLRGTLQTEPRIMLVASATARFQALRRPNEPFFELFRFVELKPLNSDACLRLWRTVSGDDAPERTIRPLEIFTGGSPRLLVVVAEFSLHRSLPRLMEELVTLIDDHTEYFRGRLERLPKGERRVYVAIIDLWQPSGTGEISTRARMGVRAVSTCIGRLVERGLVAPRGTGHRKRYLAAERLYSIYYKLRRERDEAAVVRNLIRFMVAFYTPDELLDLSDDLVQGAVVSAAIDLERLGDHSAAADAYAALDRSFGDSADPEILLRVVQGLVNLGVVQSRDLDDSMRAISTYDDIDARFGQVRTPGVRRQVAMALVNRGVAHRRLGNVEAALASWDGLVDRFPPGSDKHTDDLVADAMVRKASALAADGAFAQAHAAANHVVDTFGDAEAPAVRRRLGRAVATRCAVELDLDRPTDALASASMLEQAFADSGDEPFVWLARCHAVRAHLALGNPDDARDAFESAYQSFTPTRRSINQMILLVAEALPGGVAAKDALALFSTDQDKADALGPLVVALRQESGEDVRAPDEILEVAADIRSGWHDAGQGRASERSP